uniref:RNA-directed DNA polymerase n=1 Tax=Plectus sambesii TaxID=2011161 RepID=A0A914VQW4_9BILA
MPVSQPQLLKFEGHEEDFPIWQRQFRSAIFLSKVIDVEEKRAMLLMSLSTSVFRTFIARCHQRDVDTEVEYKELMMTLEQHYLTKPVQLAEYHRLFSLQQQSVNGHKMLLEYDMGATATILSRKDWRALGAPPLKSTKLPLKNFSGNRPKLKGKATVDVEYESQWMQLPIIVGSQRDSVIGRNWIHQMKMCNCSLNAIRSADNAQRRGKSTAAIKSSAEISPINALLEKFPSIFKEGLGHCTKIKAHLELKPDVHPKFTKACTLPFTMHDAVDAELNHFSTGLNASLDLHQYPLPRPDELYQKLNGGKIFSKIDFSDAYLQMELDEENGLHTNPKKTAAIMTMPPPENLSMLHSFLGMVNHYGKFLPSLSNRLAPLHKLLKKDASDKCIKFEWSAKCQKAFEQIKADLASLLMLTHYKPELPIIVAANASNKGIGAVIAHQMPDRRELPIAYASKLLTDMESRYPQIEKEALVLMFGIKKFH